MSTHRNLMTVCFAAVFALGLAACSSSKDDPAPPETDMTDTTDTTDMDDTDTTPAAPSDLDETQMAAADAAAAAKTAADDAETATVGAEEATMNVATQQTGESAKMNSDMARKYADMAAAEYMKAKTASDAAAGAATGPAAESAWRMAENAKDAAEDAAEMASKYAMAAVEAAKMELHIDGSMKWVDIVDADDKVIGMSSLNAGDGALTSQDDGTTTGFIESVSRDVDAIPGVDFDQRGMASDGSSSDELDNDETDNATDVAYVQAVAAGSVDIGKALDTSDDMARLTIITAREGKEDVRVFADRAEDTSSDGLLDAEGLLIADINTDATATGDQTASVKPIGSYYMATPPTTDTANALDAMDVVDPASDPVELFELSGTITGGTARTVYARVTETRRDGKGEVTGRTYRAVDIMAFAALDSPADGDSDPEAVQVTASIPTADPYSHIHFGVWASLMDNKDGDNSVIADLGIGFVQNHDGSGVTTGHVTGTATYSGDWVAVVRPMHASSLATEDGHAELTANFSTDEFTADLMGLAMLEGDLSGNTFSGTDATVSHDDMVAAGTFVGSFNGAIYGPGGAEAGGVFSFDGGTAGAFVGAFGGRDDDQ